MASRSREDDYSNNHAVKVIPVRLPALADVPQALAPQMAEFVTDRVRNRIFASVAMTGPALPGAIIEVQPETGLIRTLQTDLDRPGRLLVTTDGAWLYVVLENGRRVRRMEAGTGAWDPEFDLSFPASEVPLGDIPHPFGATDLQGLFRWGSDGVAALSAPWIWLWRSPLLAPVANADTDGDGLPDDWELDGGLDPRRPDAGEDADGDGQSNANEWQAGTDPGDAASRLSLEIRADRTVQFFGRTGRRYALETSGDLGGSWTPLEVTWTGSDTLIEAGPFTASDHPAFLRVRIQP